MPIKSHTSCQHLQVIEIICFCFSILFKTRCTCLSYECECAQVWQKLLPLLGCALFKQLWYYFPNLQTFPGVSGRVWWGLACSKWVQVNVSQLSLSISHLLSLTFLLSAAERFKVSTDSLKPSPTPLYLCTLHLLLLLLLLLAMFNTP